MKTIKQGYTDRERVTEEYPEGEDMLSNTSDSLSIGGSSIFYTNDLCKDLAVRDTSLHYFGTDTGAMKEMNLMNYKLGGKRAVYVYNQTDQTINVNLVARPAFGLTPTSTIANGVVPANGVLLLEESTKPMINTPAGSLYFTATATTAPTSGVLNARLVIGGGR
ncbi:hypothetical protein [Paenibacillus lutrae]|uniref:Uncharacterized protein n=1 Tax=Paenibacillus lutrae TaxID=2078573 RepID=A0A7X3FIJ4_9BACL|nr:hypothetical protein [Paenibacillus lutrae]MVP00358.1 hypothetical protein [Paenibacillus lutrae]